MLLLEWRKLVAELSYISSFIFIIVCRVPPSLRVRWCHRHKRKKEKSGGTCLKIPTHARARTLPTHNNKWKKRQEKISWLERKERDCFTLQHDDKRSVIWAQTNYPISRATCAEHRFWKWEEKRKHQPCFSTTSILHFDWSKVVRRAGFFVTRRAGPKKALARPGRAGYRAR